ncbi:MAG: type VII secretion protein EccB, partial [Micrococcales bacterium]|nr:type VII secretion protein EccB [Micrococcales bacterium]
VLVLGSMAFGWLRSALPDDWKNDRLVIAEDSGARYVSVKGVLHPVVNTVSARLLIPSDRFKVLAVPDEELADLRRGPTLGILGAPDSLAPADRLVDTGWVSCLGAGQQVSTAIGPSRRADAADGAALVVRSGTRAFVVGHGMRYPVAAKDLSAVEPQRTAPTDWPDALPTPLETTPCATLTTAPGTPPAVSLATVTADPPEAERGRTTVDTGYGALVRAVSGQVLGKGPVLAVDQTATAYSVVGADSEVLARLGYADDDVVPVPVAWTELFRSGPALGTDAARTVVSGTS